MTTELHSWKTASPESDSPNVLKTDLPTSDPPRDAGDAVAPGKTLQKPQRTRSPSEPMRAEVPTAEPSGTHQAPKIGSLANAQAEADRPSSPATAVPPADAPPAVATDVDRDAAARQFGYDSFESLVKDAVAFPVERMQTLMVCELKDGRWIRFDRETWPKHELLATRDEAMGAAGMKR